MVFHCNQVKVNQKGDFFFFFNVGKTVFCCICKLGISISTDILEKSMMEETDISARLQ